MRDFLDIFSLQHAPILDSLASFLDEQDLCVMRCVCRFYSTYFHDLLLKQLDLRMLLKRFVYSPDELREVLYRSKAVISGSIALQFFAKERWDKSDMDIFVPRGSLSLLRSYFVNEEGYEILPKDFTDDRHYEEDVLNLVRRETKVQLIALKSADPISHILTTFYGTAVINFITNDAAYCVFPKRTIIRREMQVLDTSPTESAEAALSKYSARGWKTVYWKEMEGDSEVREARYVGDRYTWTLSLPAWAWGRPKYQKRAQPPVRFAIGTEGVVCLRIFRN